MYHFFVFYNNPERVLLKKKKGNCEKKTNDEAWDRVKLLLNNFLSKEGKNNEEKWYVHLYIFSIVVWKKLLLLSLLFFNVGGLKKKK